MTVVSILRDARKAGVKLWLKDGQLAVNAKGGVPSDLLTRIKADKQSIVDWLAEISRETSAQNDQITHEDVTGPVPLSYSQSRLWVIEHMDNAAGLYNVPMLLDLEGALDVPALEGAISKLLERHQVLRTRFQETRDGVMQIPGAHVPFVLPLTDLSTHSDQEETLAHLTISEAAARFDLTQDLMLRARLVRLGTDRHRLIIVLHHIVTDGWSNQVILAELMQLYAGVSLPMPSLQFTDYALWQRQTLATRGQALADWWANTLTDAPELHAIATDFPRPSVISSAGARHFALLPDDLVVPLRDLASTQGVSLYQLMLSAFAAFLHRQSGCTDMIIGTPIAGRERHELKSLVGFLTNTLPLRLRPQASEDFTQFLQRCVHDINAAFSHQDIPFEMIVERVNPNRSLSHAPLAQVAFTLVQHETPTLPTHTPLRMTPADCDLTPAKFELSLAVGDHGQAIEIDWSYATDLFHADTIDQYHKAFVSLLHGIVEQPQTPLADLPIVSASEIQDLLELGAGTQIEYPDLSTITEMIEARAKATPAKRAMVMGSLEFSYSEMNSRANQIAHYMLHQGVKPGDCIGIATGSGPLMVIAALAANKAGGAFVQLPVDAPAARIEHILQDCSAQFVLTASHIEMAQDLSSGLIIDTPGPWDGMKTTNPNSQRTDLCYVVYTSGTSGKPKGAMNSHQGIANMCLWKTRDFGISQDTIHTVAANPTFDALNWELWPTLTQGGTLAFLPEDDLKDVGRLQALIDTIAPTHFWLPTGLMEAMCASGLRIPSSVGLVATGGDRLQHYCLPSGCGLPLANIYGPSEAAVITIGAFLTEENNAHDAPIGRPADNTICYIMDDDGHLLPRGAIGELCISGVFLGQGYINRRALTAEKYVPNPFFRPGHEIVYRTGDLARWRSDGQLECLGRTDFQVKIRGYRIEPQEVASVLLEHPDIQAAFVDLAQSSNKHLVAYCVAESGSDSHATETQAQETLRDLLPSYMIPDHYVWVSNIPLTERGKIDRKSLALQDIGQNNKSQVNTSSPRDAIELRLIEIWCNVLVHPTIGLRDNFFDVGGNSLSAIKIIHDINTEFGSNLPATDLIAHPTIEALGAILRADQSETSKAPTNNPICFRKGDGKKNVICIHPGGGTAFGYMSLAQNLPQEYGVWGVQSVGVDPGEEFLPDLGAMAAHYITLCADLLDKPFVVTGASFGGMIAYEIVRLLQLEGNEMGTAVMLDAMGSDDPSLRANEHVSNPQEFREKLVTYNGMYPGIDDKQISQYHALYNHNLLCSRRWGFSKSHGRTLLIQAIDGRTKTQLLFLRFFWKQRSKGAFLFKCTAGDHSTMLSGSDVQRIGVIIDKILRGQLLPRKDVL